MRPDRYITVMVNTLKYFGTCHTKLTKFCRFVVLVIRSSSAEYSKDICGIVKGIRGIVEGHLRNGRRHPLNCRRAFGGLRLRASPKSSNVP